MHVSEWRVITWSVDDPTPKWQRNFISCCLDKNIWYGCRFNWWFCGTHYLWGFVCVVYQLEASVNFTMNNINKCVIQRLRFIFLYWYFLFAKYFISMSLCDLLCFWLHDMFLIHVCAYDKKSLCHCQLSVSLSLWLLKLD